MIILNSVSKEIGRGAFRRLVVDDVTWTIPRRAQIAILGHRGAGVSQLLEIIAGTSLPTKGWVKRQATTSLPSGYLRFAGFGTVRTLIDRLSILYNADPRELAEFVETGLQNRQALDVPVRRLPAVLRRQLNFVLLYAVPCEIYLFDGGIVGGGNEEFRAFCQKAFETRRREAGMIVAVSSTRAAATFDKSMGGAILYRAKLTLYRHLSDAMMVFDSLPPEEALPTQALAAEPRDPEEEEYL